MCLSVVIRQMTGTGNGDIHQSQPASKTQSQSLTVASKTQNKSLLYRFSYLNAALAVTCRRFPVNIDESSPRASRRKSFSRKVCRIRCFPEILVRPEGSGVAAVSGEPIWVQGSRSTGVLSPGSGLGFN